MERQLCDNGIVVGVDLHGARVIERVGRVFGVLDSRALEVGVAVDLRARN